MLHKGKLIKDFGSTLTSYRPFNSGVALVGNGKESFFVNTSGEKAFPLIFSSEDKVSEFHNGYAIINNGIMLPNGKWSVPPSQQYSIKSKAVNDGVVVATQQNENKEYVDVIVAARTGKIVAELPSKYTLGYGSSDGLIKYIERESSLEGMVDRLGKIIIPAKFKRLEKFVSGFAKFTDTKGNIGYINRKQQLIGER